MKRVGFISDLHIDHPAIRTLDIETQLADLIARKELDTLFIGGDISNHYLRTFEFVESLQERSGIPVYFIPGNHDYWQKNQNSDILDTWQIYDEFKNHPQSLIETTLDLTDKTSVVGHSFWYNHAVYSNEFSHEKINRGIYKGGRWQDKAHINWGMSDKEVSGHFAGRVDDQLGKISPDRQIILMSHVVVIPEYTVPMPHRIFDFFNAYIATDDVVPLIERYPITHVSMGHVHFRHQMTKADGVHYMVNCLGYKKEWRTDDLKQELESALVVLEVE